MLAQTMDQRISNKLLNVENNKYQELSKPLINIRLNPGETFLNQYKKLSKYGNKMEGLPLSYLYMINWEDTIEYVLEILVLNGLDRLSIETDDFYNLVEFLQATNATSLSVDPSFNIFTKEEMSHISSLNEKQLKSIIRNSKIIVKDLPNDKASLLFIILSRGILVNFGDFKDNFNYNEMKVYHPRTIVSLVLLFANNDYKYEYPYYTAYLQAANITNIKPNLIEFIESTNKTNIREKMMELGYDIGTSDYDFSNIYAEAYIPLLKEKMKDF